jgi:hypothetical protein
MINMEAAAANKNLLREIKDSAQQGMLLYRGNRFVRRLEGPLDIVAPGQDTDA